MTLYCGTCRTRCKAMRQGDAWCCPLCLSMIAGAEAGVVEARPDERWWDRFKESEEARMIGCVVEAAVPKPKRLAPIRLPARPQPMELRSPRRGGVEV